MVGPFDAITDYLLQYSLFWMSLFTPNSNTIIMVVLAFLMTKHFVVDFLMQSPYMYLNKGKFGHPGGLLHSGFHAAVTGLGLYAILPNMEMIQAFGWIALAEFVIHYFTDYAKVNINKRTGWGPTTHWQYWWLLGLDQYIHAMTYVGIVYAVIRLVDIYYISPFFRLLD